MHSSSYFALKKKLFNDYLLEKLFNNITSYVLSKIERSKHRMKTCVVFIVIELNSVVLQLFTDIQRDDFIFKNQFPCLCLWWLTVCIIGLQHIVWLYPIKIQESSESSIFWWRISIAVLYFDSLSTIATVWTVLQHSVKISLHGFRWYPSNINPLFVCFWLNSTYTTPHVFFGYFIENFRKGLSQLIWPE